MFKAILYLGKPRPFQGHRSSILVPCEIFEQEIGDGSGRPLSTALVGMRSSWTRRKESFGNKAAASQISTNHAAATLPASSHDFAAGSGGAIAPSKDDHATIRERREA